MREKVYDTVIGIDPDVDRNGVACINCATKKIIVQSLTFPALLEYLHQQNKQDCIVIIEAGWLNKAHWHLTYKDTKQAAAAKGNSAGRNHEVGRKVAEMCEYWGINYKLMKPLRLTVGKHHIWKGKDGKITHEELVKLTGIEKKRTNQEERDAVLIAYNYMCNIVNL